MSLRRGGLTAWVPALLLAGLCRSPVSAVVNNGFETDWVYAIRTSDASLVALRESDGELMATLLSGVDLKDPASTGWVSLTFSGTPSNNDARLYVAQAFARQVGAVKQHSTDIRIAELDAQGNAVRSATLSSLLPGAPAQVGPYTRLANIRYSSYHRSLFLGADPHYRDDQSRAHVYEVDLDLRRILNTYVGATVHNDEPNIDLSPIDGTLYVCEANMGQPPIQNEPRRGQGDLIAIDTSRGSTDVFVSLVDGYTYQMKDRRWRRPMCPIWRGPHNPTGQSTLLVLQSGEGVGPWPQLEFFLGSRDDTELRRASLRVRGSPYTARRSAWRGQLDEMTGTVMATRLQGKDRLAGIDLIAPDDTVRVIGQAWGWQDADSPGISIRPPRVPPAGMPQLDPQDPRWLVMHAERFYPCGYYPRLSSMIAQPPGQDRQAFYRALHEQLAASGLNYYRTVFSFGQPILENANQTMVFKRSNVPGAADGGNKFDLDAWNDEHFSFWRGLIQHARSKGIVVQLCILDSWHNKHFKSKPRQWDLKFDFYAGANNINGVDADGEDAWHSTDPQSPVWKRHTRLIEAVVDRLADQPNIVWEVSNEPRPYYDGADAEVAGKTTNDWAIQIGRHLKTYEAKTRGYNHLCVGVDLPDHQHVAGQRPDWFMTQVEEKDGHTPAGAHRDLAGQARTLQPRAPLISDNDAGRSGLDVTGVRQKGWAVLTAGGHTSYFEFRMGDLETVRSRGVIEGMKYLGFVPKFIRDLSVNLRGMVPSDELVSNGWCLARPGEEYVVYLITGGETTVKNLPERCTATWFNPRTAEQLPGPSGPVFKAPDANDWVLHIRR